MFRTEFRARRAERMDAPGGQSSLHDFESYVDTWQTPPDHIIITYRTSPYDIKSPFLNEYPGKGVHYMISLLMTLD